MSTGPDLQTAAGPRATGWMAATPDDTSSDQEIGTRLRCAATTEADCHGSNGDGRMAECVWTRDPCLQELEAALDLFQTPSGDPYVTTVNGDTPKTWPIPSAGLRTWLARQLLTVTGSPPASRHVEELIRRLQMWAGVSGLVRSVFVRVGHDAESAYLDLRNAAGEVVRVTGDGWQVMPMHPVRFRRPAGMLALPRPVPGGTLEELRAFVNVGAEADWRLLVAWVIAALQPHGPYPALILQGEQGTAKSTTARVLRALLDPAAAPLRSAPQTERDLVISADQSWLLLFDNLSALPPWLADGLCRIATGGGFATRRLYTNAEQVLIDVSRPIILTGIDDLVTRFDLVDRAIVLQLPPIRASARRPEQVFWQRFAEAHPRLLGAVLTTAATALRHRDEVWLPELPRMADFACWATAVERALDWPTGSTLRAYQRNRDDAILGLIDGRPVAHAVRTLMERRREWVGTATELLRVLDHGTHPSQPHRGSWPSSPVALRNELRRLLPALHAMGIQLDTWRAPNRMRDRMLRLYREQTNPQSLVRNVHPSTSEWDMGSMNSLRTDDADETDGTPP
jgi:hypothetical protein